MHLETLFIYSTTISQRAHIIITPVIGFNFNSALNTVHNFHSLRNIPASRHVTGAIMPIHATNNVRILPGTHTPGWRAAMWIKCLAEGEKVPGIDGNRTRNPLIQSQGFTLIYHNHNIFGWMSNMAKDSSFTSLK